MKKIKLNHLYYHKYNKTAYIIRIFGSSVGGDDEFIIFCVKCYNVRTGSVDYARISKAKLDEQMYDLKIIRELTTTEKAKALLLSL